MLTSHGDRSQPATRYIIAGFQRQENAILEPIVLLVASLQLRNLLPDTVEEILARAATYPNRRIEIGTPEEAYKTVFCRVDKNGYY